MLIVTLKHMPLRVKQIIFSMQVCASAVLLFSKGNHQYEYSASYVTPALSILCIATIWPIAIASNLLNTCTCTLLTEHSNSNSALQEYKTTYITSKPYKTEGKFKFKFKLYLKSLR